MPAGTLIIGYVVAISAIFGFSAVSAFDFRQRRFSGNVFLLSIAICIPLMIWMGLFPVYSIILSCLAIAGILIGSGGTDE